MISRIVIEKLHNLYDYDIQIPDEQRVSIITGPNGYGKTTLLKIISYLLACKFWFFYFLKFKSITIYFQNGIYILLKKDIDRAEDKSPMVLSEIVNTKEQICVEFYLNGAVVDSLVLGSTYMARLVRKYAMGISSRFKEDFDLENALENDYLVENDTYLSDNGKSICMFLQEQSCRFVKEQRLVADNSFRVQHGLHRATNNNNEFEINIIAERLQKLFAENQMEFAMKSQEIDATFIRRLIHEEHSQYEEEVFRKKLDVLKRKMTDYRKYGLAPQTDILEEYPDRLQHVLSLYIDDMEAKLSIFDDFYKKLSLFDLFVSGKSLSNKRIEFNDKKGISVYNENNEEIPLNKLSGGEQNLIILYYQLVFTTNSNSLLLIDEPENSLHMAWLSLMLKDYQRMADDLKCQIIIATHSPVFIDSQWDITFDLFLNDSTKKEQFDHGDFFAGNTECGNKSK